MAIHMYRVFPVLAALLFSALSTACAVSSPRPLYAEAEGSALPQSTFKLKVVSGECPQIPDEMVFQRSGRHYDAFGASGDYAGRLTLAAQRMGYIAQFEEAGTDGGIYFPVEPHLRGFRVYRLVKAGEFASHVVRERVNSAPGTGPSFAFELLTPEKLRVRTRQDLEGLFQYARQQGEYISSCVVSLVP